MSTTSINNINLVSIMEGGFLLACSLSWAETIKLGVKELIPDDQETLFITQLIYSIILTIIVIMLTYQLQLFKTHFS